MSKKWFQRVPKWTPKVDQNRQKVCSGGVPKRDLKKVPSPGPGKVRSGYYLLHFSKVRGLKKYTFLGQNMRIFLHFDLNLALLGFPGPPGTWGDLGEPGGSRGKILTGFF